VLRRGLVIMEINRRAVTTVAEYDRLVGAARAGDVLAIYYYDPAMAQRSLVTVVVD
jgi:S1-C subfamily serine protease